MPCRADKEEAAPGLCCGFSVVEVTQKKNRSSLSLNVSDMKPTLPSFRGFNWITIFITWHLFCHCHENFICYITRAFTTPHGKIFNKKKSFCLNILALNVVSGACCLLKLVSKILAFSVMEWTGLFILSSVLGISIHQNIGGILMVLKCHYYYCSITTS